MKSLTKKPILTITLTSVYLLILIWLILFKISSPFEVMSWERVRSINFIPFYYDAENSFHLREVMENILIFIPFGLYFKMLKINGAYTVLLGMGFSFIMEAAQYIFGIGAADVTDLITNTLGTAVGVGLYVLLLFIFKNRDKLNRALNFIALTCTVLFIGLTALLLWAN